MKRTKKQIKEDLLILIGVVAFLAVFSIVCVVIQLIRKKKKSNNTKVLVKSIEKNLN